MPYSIAASCSSVAGGIGGLIKHGVIMKNSVSAYKIWRHRKSVAYRMAETAASSNISSAAAAKTNQCETTSGSGIKSGISAGEWRSKKKKKTSLIA